MPVISRASPYLVSILSPFCLHLVARFRLSTSAILRPFEGKIVIIQSNCGRETALSAAYAYSGAIAPGSGTGWTATAENRARRVPGVIAFRREFVPA